MTGIAVREPALCLQLSARHDLDRVSVLVFEVLVDLIVLQPRAAPLATALVVLTTPEQRLLMIRKLPIALAAMKLKVPLLQFGDSAFQVARPAEPPAVCAARDLHAVENSLHRGRRRAEIGTHRLVMHPAAIKQSQPGQVGFIGVGMTHLADDLEFVNEIGRTQHLRFLALAIVTRFANGNRFFSCFPLVGINRNHLGGVGGLGLARRHDSRQRQIALAWHIDVPTLPAALPCRCGPACRRRGVACSRNDCEVVVANIARRSRCSRIIPIVRRNGEPEIWQRTIERCCIDLVELFAVGCRHAEAVHLGANGAC